jgi:hypothetical protein
MKLCGFFAGGEMYKSDLENKRKEAELNRNNLELLEMLSFQMGCMYLSDLKQPQYLSFIRRALKQIETTRYSIREWEDAVRYLTGEKKEFASHEEVRAYVLSGGRWESRQQQSDSSEAGTGKAVSPYVGFGGI